MSNPNHQELVHHNQPSSLPKEDTLHSSRTSVLNQGPFMGSLPDDQCSPRPHGHAHDYDDALDDVFSIPPKTPLNPTYQRWKKATLVLNASRRFRYTTDLKGCEKRLHHLRTTAHAVRAARRFQQSTINKDTRVSIESHALDLASEESLQRFEAPETALTPASRETHICITIPSNGYVSSPDQMARLVQERNLSALEELGGVEGVARGLEASFENGLKNDAQYIQERRDKFGSNTYPPQPSKPFCSFVFDACKDPKLSVLIVCSLGFGIKSYGIKEGFHDGMNIALAVLVVLLVTSIREYWQSLQFLYLSKEKSIIPVHVIREGRKLQISIFELVVGDLVSLGTGDQVPADGLFVDGHSLLLDESSMTGESGPVDIDYKRPYLLSGCKVADGYGTMLVTGVGMKTEWGRLMAEPIEDSGEETPLQVRLNGLTIFVRKIGLSIAVLELLILVILYVTGHREGANNAGKFRPGHTSNDTIMNSIVDILERANISDILATAITLMIVAVPDGLSVAFTLSLAYAMKKMSDRALVRRLAACETMGSVTTICTDKTGTLTLNTMTVVKVCVGSDELRDAENLPHISSNLNRLLLEGIAQNNSASVFVPPGGEPEVMGSPTDKAVLMWGLRMGMNFNQVRSLSKILQVETFNSIKKRAGVAVKVTESGKVHVHWKGAAEIVLEECNFLMGADDSILPMTAVKKRELLNVIDEMACQSLRCIAFSYREVLTEEIPSRELLDVFKIPEGPLTLIAIVGIQDPCRPGVQEAVHQCKAAGIKVRMLTGDNIATAKAVATECGILEDGGIAIEGATFRNYSDEMRRNKLPKISVMARSTPSDKLLMVRTLREMGEVVAVTGDGTNDVPTLHEADIGLAMGIQGTEVAKESSDIIILDDNFATIVKVVRWGRSVYVNIQKFIQFQLTVNVAASTINFILPFIVSGDAPLTSVQLLWVNLIVDTLAALALLASEPPTDGLLEWRPPVGRKEVLISNTMVRDLLLQAIYQIVVLLIFQFRGKQLFNLDFPNSKDINNTVIFNTFVLCQLFNALNARKPEGLNIFKGLSQHGLFIGIIASTSVVQVILVECLNKFASTVKLSWNCWVTCIMVGFLSWPIAFMGKSMLTPIEGWEGRGNGRGRRKREKKEKKGKGKGERKKEKGTAQN